MRLWPFPNKSAAFNRTHPQSQRLHPGGGGLASCPDASFPMLTPTSQKRWREGTARRYFFFGFFFALSWSSPAGMRSPLATSKSADCFVWSSRMVCVPAWDLLFRCGRTPSLSAVRATLTFSPATATNANASASLFRFIPVCLSIVCFSDARTKSSPEFRLHISRRKRLEKGDTEVMAVIPLRSRTSLAKTMSVGWAVVTESNGCVYRFDDGAAG